MADPLNIRLRHDWDTALTYDSLDDAPTDSPADKFEARRPVFVGRETLIAPLVAEISQENKRGTYLISGYRGTGKTTLLIEALNRAKLQLETAKLTLFPVVLNVSEVSASLGNTTEASPVKLDIDPRRLLIALIRQIRDGISRLLEKSRQNDNNDRTEALTKLAQTVNYAYEKATASKFSIAATSLEELTRTRHREFSLNLEDKSLLKTVAAIASTGAVALGSVAWLPNASWLKAAAIWLAGIATVGLAAVYKRTRSERRTNAKQTALEHDNSLQQLETDLKDILAELKKNKLRTVVVMEELDKIEDEEGTQLAAVIRYFKNLFTQAPALFFFVTDKSYFDIVASAIKRARRGRSYAVEHTFFTHRIFVGRPTTEECLQFITAIAEEEEDRKAIQKVAETLGKPGRTKDADRFGKFVRVVLFNAANHMFDLKNELRRFARNKEQQVNSKPDRVTSFVVDDQTLPPEQEALAIFQDLIVEKSRSFEIKGGRAYANETLVDSLYAVFNELGSNQPQPISSFLPITHTDSKEALLLDEQLDLSEAARVREAVESLIGDLERGRALSRNPEDNSFRWRDDAARSFRYIRQLQKHEETLIAELQRNAALVNGLNAGADPPEPHPVALELEKRVGEVREASEPMTADAAAAEQRKLLDVYGAALSNAFSELRSHLAVYGFNFDLIRQGLAGSVYLVKPNSGDPRLRTAGPRGAVLLAFGETETLVEDVWSFIRPDSPSFFPLNRAALVHVIHTTMATEVEYRWKQWLEVLKKRADNIYDFRFAVDVVPLVGTVEGQKLDTIQRTAAAMVGFGGWSRPEVRAYQPIAPDTPLTLKESLKSWRHSKSSIFHIQGSSGNVSGVFGQRDELEIDGDVVFSLGPVKNDGSLPANVAAECMLLSFEQASGPMEMWAPLGEWLLQNNRMILHVNLDAMYGWKVQDVVEALRGGARVVVTKTGSLPEELHEFEVTEAPPTVEVEGRPS